MVKKNISATPASPKLVSVKNVKAAAQDTIVIECNNKDSCKKLHDVVRQKLKIPSMHLPRIVLYNDSEILLQDKAKILNSNNLQNSPDNSRSNFTLNNEIRFVLMTQTHHGSSIQTLWINIIITHTLNLPDSLEMIQ